LHFLGVKVTSCPELKNNEYVLISERPKPDPIAAARTPDDGSLVVVYQPANLEVRAFGAEDLDERGMPRRKP
jgi:hypothetical protein